MKSVLSLVLFVAFAVTPAAAQDAAPADTNEAPAAQQSDLTQPTPVSSAPATSTPTGEVDKKDAVPPRYHSGWGTLVKDTAHDFVQFPKRPSTS